MKIILTLLYKATFEEEEKKTLGKTSIMGYDVPSTDWTRLVSGIRHMAHVSEIDGDNLPNDQMRFADFHFCCLPSKGTDSTEAHPEYDTPQ
jgi:hypothetical protein